MIQEPLLDKSFLKQLFKERNREIYAKIISLSFNEEPLEEIQGRISSGGNINIDGNSAVRRSCQLELTTEKTNISDYYWSINSKFKLEIGLKNYIDSKYPDVIWFKQGTYIITSFNQVLNTSSSKISITGKDKMCLLNGEVGGQFSAPVKLANILTVGEDGKTITDKKRLLLKQIILNLLHEFGGESLENIIINDLEDTAVELLQYKGDSDIFFFRDKNGIVKNMSTDAEQSCWIEDKDAPGGRIHTTIGNVNAIKYYSLSPYSNNHFATDVSLSSDGGFNYNIIKIEYGQTAGYRKTEVTYPGDLDAAAGATITSILDQIIKTFSDFEYFYNIYGKFVFQKKKTYINSAWSPIQRDLKVELFSDNNEYVYSFDDNELVTSFTNTPNILNLKNDFSVWGQKKKTKTSFHVRYAFDKKPDRYVTTGLGDEKSKEYLSTQYDWREIIYQMAKDYYDNNQKGREFYRQLYLKNGQFINGRTGYEQYYTDLLGFWREIYDGQNWTELVETPEELPFWIDFIEGDASFVKYNVPSIGDRTKVVNDSSSTAISFRETINVLYVDNLESEDTTNDGYTYIQLPKDLQELFEISEAQKSAQNEIDNLLYNHSYCVESVTIQAVPVYILEPNTKILVSDNQNGIYGQYIVNKISIPLSYNGMMSINAIKDIERIY